MTHSKRGPLLAAGAVLAAGLAGCLDGDSSTPAAPSTAATPHASTGYIPQPPSTIAATTGFAITSSVAPPRRVS